MSQIRTQLLQITKL